MRTPGIEHEHTTGRVGDVGNRRVPGGVAGAVPVRVFQRGGGIRLSTRRRAPLGARRARVERGPAGEAERGEGSRDPSRFAASAAIPL